MYPASRQADGCAAIGVQDLYIGRLGRHQPRDLGISITTALDQQIPGAQGIHGNRLIVTAVATTTAAAGLHCQGSTGYGDRTGRRYVGAGDIVVPSFQ